MILEFPPEDVDQPEMSEERRKAWGICASMLTYLRKMDQRELDFAEYIFGRAFKWGWDKRESCDRPGGEE